MTHRSFVQLYCFTLLLTLVHSQNNCLTSGLCTCPTSTSCACNPGYTQTGTFPLNSANTICTPCGAGTFSSVSQSTECSNCLNGTYSQPGASACTSCPSGTYSYSINGASACTSCINGSTFSTHENSTSCSSCSSCEGYFFYQEPCTITKDTVCKACPPGSVAITPGATTCTCAPSSISTLTSPIIDANGVVTSCCPVNSTFINGKCQCNQNFAQSVINGSVLSCTPCLPGWFSASGAPSCSLCPAGSSTSGPNGECISCNFGGTFSIEPGGATSCTLCTLENDLQCDSSQFYVERCTLKKDAYCNRYPTKTPSPTATVSASTTMSSSSSPLATKSSTITTSVTASPSTSASAFPSYPTETPSSSGSSSASRSPLASYPSNSATGSASALPSFPSNSASGSSTVTGSPSQSGSSTVSSSVTVSSQPTGSTTISSTGTVSSRPSGSSTITSTVSGTSSQTISSSSTNSPSSSPSVTASSTISGSAAPTNSPSTSVTVTSSASASALSTFSGTTTSTATHTGSNSPSPSPTPTPSATPSVTATLPSSIVKFGFSISSPWGKGSKGTLSLFSGLSSFRSLRALDTNLSAFFTPHQAFITSMTQMSAPDGSWLGLTLPTVPDLNRRLRSIITPPSLPVARQLVSFRDIDVWNMTVNVLVRSIVPINGENPFQIVISKVLDPNFSNNLSTALQPALIVVAEEAGVLDSDLILNVPIDASQSNPNRPRVATSPSVSANPSVKTIAVYQDVSSQAKEETNKILAISLGILLPLLVLTIGFAIRYRRLHAHVSTLHSEVSDLHAEALSKINTLTTTMNPLKGSVTSGSSSSSSSSSKKKLSSTRALAAQTPLTVNGREATSSSKKSKKSPSNVQQQAAASGVADGIKKGLYQQQFPSSLSSSLSSTSSTPTLLERSKQHKADLAIREVMSSSKSARMQFLESD